MHPLTFSVLATTLLASSAPVAPPGTAPPSTILEQEVRAVRQQLKEAAKNRDRAAYERLLADGFTFIHATGPVDTRAEYIEQTLAGGQLFQRADREVQEETIRFYPGPTAITVSTVVFRNRSDSSETRLRSTNVFVKVDGRWQWAAGQSTRLPNRPPAMEIDRALHYPRYVGTYRVGPARTLTVTIDGNKLAAVVTGFPPAELVPRSPNHFVWFNPEMNVFSEVLFELGEDGNAREAIFRRDGIELWRAKRAASHEGQ